MSKPNKNNEKERLHLDGLLNGARELDRWWPKKSRELMLQIDSQDPDASLDQEALVSAIEALFMELTELRRHVEFVITESEGLDPLEVQRLMSEIKTLESYAFECAYFATLINNGDDSVVRLMAKAIHALGNHFRNERMQLASQCLSNHAHDVKRMLTQLGGAGINVDRILDRLGTSPEILKLLGLDKKDNDPNPRDSGPNPEPKN